MDERALTASELAEILQVSTKTLHRYAVEGTIPSMRVGRSWRFWLEDVREALATPVVDLWARPNRRKIGQRAETRGPQEVRKTNNLGHQPTTGHTDGSP